MPQKKAPQTRINVKRLLTSIAILAAVVFVIGLLIGTRISKGSNTTTINAELVESRLKEVAELPTVNYQYKHMKQFDNTDDFYGVSVPYMTRKLILSYAGQIKAGVDLRNLKATVVDKTITITLPDPKILTHAIDENSIMIFDEDNKIFNPFRIEDMTTFTADQKTEIEKEVLEKGLLNQASESAKAMVKSIFTMDKALFGDYEIVFK